MGASWSWGGDTWEALPRTTQIPTERAATGTFRGHDFFVGFLQFLSDFQRHPSVISSVSDLMSRALEEFAADDDVFASGGGGGNDTAKSQVPVGYPYDLQIISLVIQSAGSLGMVKVKQGTSKKRILNVGDFEVSSPPNIHEDSRKGSGADVAGGYTVLNSVNYIEVLKLYVGRFFCHVSENRGNCSLINSSINLRNIFIVVTGLVVLLWNGVRVKRKEMEVLSARIMVDAFFAKKSSGWYEIAAPWLMDDGFVVRILEARLFDGKSRIIVSGLFSGAVHAVHRRLIMCLFSVISYTVLFLALPVQCVWIHCSTLGWNGDPTFYYMDARALLYIAMVSGVLEFLPSRNFVRNHHLVWVPMEAYLATGWFVKASLDALTCLSGYFELRCSQRLSPVLVLVTVSFCIVMLFIVVFFLVLVWTASFLFLLSWFVCISTY